MNIPTFLTLLRIAIIPVVVVTFYIPGHLMDWLACALFVGAAVTDFFDGYLARSLNQVSNFGRFLDPIADKLLVASVLLMLAAGNRLGISGFGLIPAIIILCREILVSGLREFLAELKVSMPVTKLAKWKTTAQLLALSFLILGDSMPAWMYLPLLGEIFLWVSALLTMITGFDYMKAGMRHMSIEPVPETSNPADETN